MRYLEKLRNSVMEKILILCSKDWFFREKKVKQFIKGNKVIVIKKKKDFNLTKLKKINPKYIFFPHWSFKISNKILSKYKCIGFHTSNLPFGRGGSPIQNQIKRGIVDSKVCAFQITEKIDNGAIYLKKKIKLNGKLSEIFSKLSIIIIEMIKKICKVKIIPKPQHGKSNFFKRLTYLDNKINFKKSLDKIYDQIRMVDDKTYKNSYYDLYKYRIEFFNVKFHKKILTVNAKIYPR